MEPTIRAVRYVPPPGVTGEIELTSLARMRARGGPQEFLAPQRLEFDILMRITSGSAVHTVDFTGYVVGPGDLVWVRAGQVQQWGAIDDIEGPVVLYTPTVIDSRSWELIRGADVTTPVHWPGPIVAGGSAEATFHAVVAIAESPSPSTPARQAALASSLAATLLLLMSTERDESRHRQPARDAFIRFRDSIEEHFRTDHQVAQYGARLGYSPHTLNRFARDHTGLTAKQLIDERIILEAKRMLAHGSEPVARLAEQLGFDDASNFTKYFDHRTGTTPAAFRAGVR